MKTYEENKRQLKKVGEKIKRDFSNQFKGGLEPRVQEADWGDELFYKSKLAYLFTPLTTLTFLIPFDIMERLTNLTYNIKYIPVFATMLGFGLLAQSRKWYHEKYGN